MSTNNSFNLNLERLNRLNEKLNNVRKIFVLNNYPQTTTDTIKNTKYEFLANRTMDLNDRLDEVISQSKNKFNIVKDSVSFILDIYIYIIYNIDKYDWKTNRRRE